MQKKLFLFFFLSVGCFLSYGQVYFSEGFESGGIPATWSQDYIVASPTVAWEVGYGGDIIIDDIKVPQTPKNGSYNAIFPINFETERITRLITPYIDLSSAGKPELTYWHAQSGDAASDLLRVYIKSNKLDDWLLIEEFLNPIDEWEQASYFIPDTILDDSVQIAFEGETKWEQSVVLDSIDITERGIIPLHVQSYDIQATDIEHVATNSKNNPVLMIEIFAFGNTGELYLDELSFNGIVTNNSDIASNGINLYYTDDENFNPLDSVSVDVSFSNSVTISGIDKQLQFGKNFFWIAYDIDNNAVDLNTVDISIDANDIVVRLDTQNITFTSTVYPEGDEIVYIIEDTNRVDIFQTLPLTNVSPSGNVEILKAVLFDDFETDTNWIMTGDFEIDTVQGLGGNDGGNPDPEFAMSGAQSLGNDLRTDGDYELDFIDSTYYARTKVLDLTFYKDIYVSHYRYLNSESLDKTRMSVSADSGKTWSIVLSGGGSDNHWIREELDLSAKSLDRKPHVMVRYSINPDVSNDRSGWNIDDFALMGDFLSNDVGVNKVVSPVDRCISSIEDSVVVWVYNYAGIATKDTIPIEYYVVGEGIQYSDTIFSSIGIGDSIEFEFANKFSIITPGTKKLVVKTNMDGDEDNSNDSIVVNLYYQPTYDLPYIEEFTSNNGYWKTSGVNSTWTWGTPTGGLYPPPSPDNVWVTKIGGNYENYDSSFFESVCINIPDSQMILLDFQYWLESESKKDGVLLEYSLDEGSTWTYFETDTFDWAWNWYNDTTDLLDSMSFTGNSTSWGRARQIVPSAVLGKDRVKFRFHFQSDSVNNYRGVGIDDIRVAAAPMDIGISGFIGLDTACQHINSPYLKLVLENFGINDLVEDDEVVIGVIYDGNPIVWDTIILDKDLPGFDTIHVTFPQSFSYNDNPGSHSITAFTTGEQLPNVYGSDNDTAKTNVFIYPNPITDLPDSVGSLIPDTFVLRPYVDPDYTYLWTGGSTANTFDVPDVGWYSLTVTDTDSSGCITVDSVKVVQYFRDLGIDSVLYPLSACSYTDTELVTVRLHNFGTDALLSGEEFVLAFEFDGGPMLTDTILLDADLNADSTVAFTFDKDTIDISALTTYNIKTYSRMLGDTVNINDTTYHTFSVYGYPIISLGEDTIVKALSYQLDPGGGYADYLWSNDSTSETIDVDSSGIYWAAVTNSDGCTSYDTVDVVIKIRDVTPDSVLTPFTQCIPGSMQTIKLRLLNTGNDTILTSDTIFIAHTTNEGSIINDTIFTPQDIYPDSSWICEFNSEINFVEDTEYRLLFNINAVGDLRAGNDSIYDTITYYSYPAISLGSDTIVRALSYNLEPGNGYASYLWSNDSTSETINIDSSGIYWVEVTTDKGCMSYDTVDVYFKIRDVKANMVLSPVTQCIPETMELIQLELSNTGNDTILTSDTIFIAHTINEGSIINDTVFTSQNIYPDSSWICEFSSDINFIEDTEYRLLFNVNAVGDLIPANDSVFDTITYFGYPVISLGNDTIVKALSYNLEPGGGYDSYLWSNSSISETISVDSSGLYWVEVATTNGCTVYDTVDVYFKIRDVKPMKFLTPVTQCVPETMEKLSVQLFNAGNDTILTTDTIFVTYTINGGSLITDTSFVGQNVYPDSVWIYQSANAVNFTEDVEYEFAFNINAVGDLIPANDSLIDTAAYYSYPVVELGNDTVIKWISHTLDAGYTPTYTYKWQDDSDSSLYVANATGWYKVTVTSSHNCATQDSIWLKFIVPDIGITQLIEPSNLCNTSDSSLLSVRVRNFGTDTIVPQDTLLFKFDVETQSANQEATFSSELYPGDSVVFTFAKKVLLSNTQAYNIKVSGKFDRDLNAANDTLKTSLEVLSEPYVDFGVNDDTIKVVDDSYILNAGGNYHKYLWSDESTSQSIIVQNDGNYSVTVTDKNSCTGTGSLYVMLNVDTCVNNPNCYSCDTIDDCELCPDNPRCQYSCDTIDDCELCPDNISCQPYSCDTINDCDLCPNNQGCKSSVDQTVAGALAVYPNPASEKIFVNVPQELINTRFTIKIINVNGQVLSIRQVERISGNAEIRLNNVSNGLYYLIIDTEDTVYRQKIVINRN